MSNTDFDFSNTRDRAFRVILDHYKDRPSVYLTLLGKFSQLTKTWNANLKEELDEETLKLFNLFAKLFSNNEYLFAYTTEFVTTAFANNPFRAFHKNNRNKIDNTHVNGVTITARSLLLDKGTSLTPDVPGYGNDNYIDCLGISWKWLRGKTTKKLLDVGCGYSLFPAEASLWGITVVGLECNPVIDITIKEKILNQYKKNWAFAQYIHKARDTQPIAFAGLEPVINTCSTSLQKTGNKYLEFRPTNGDCTKQLPFSNNEFDCVLCSWVFMYLSADDALKALKEIVRVTRPGGEIRIQHGYWMGGQKPGKGLDFTEIEKITNIKKQTADWNGGYIPTHHMLGKSLIVLEKNG